MSAPTRGSGNMPRGALLPAIFAMQIWTSMACQPASANSSGQPDKQTVDQDPFEQSGFVFARHHRISQSLQMPDILSFSQLSSPARSKLDRLITASAITIDVYAVGDRLLFVFPRGQPNGPFELLFDRATQELIAFFERGKQRMVVSRDQLPDLLDLVQESRRELVAIEHQLSKKGSTSSAEETRLRLRYRPTVRRAATWNLRIWLRVTGRRHHQIASLPYHSLYELALPLLGSTRDRQLSTWLTREGLLPTRWTRTVRNDSQPGLDVRVLAKLEDRRWIRLPNKRFCRTRPEFKTVRRLPQTKGEQLQPPERIVGLRGATTRGALSVTNNSNFAAVLYVDGARLGWVAPHREIAIAGLTAGYYRIFAVAPTGVRSWGPSDIYVPGPIILR